MATVEPPGGLDKTLWQKSGIDPRPWKQKFYEGNKEYYLVITAKHLTSYTIEARVPGADDYNWYCTRVNHDPAVFQGA